MVKIKNITKIFEQGTINENIAIKNIDLTINEGDFITIIGSNGAGKSTLFNLISGNILPTTGKIYVDDKEITKDPEHKRAKYIGRIFQNPLLGTASNMSIEENMMIANKKGMRGLSLSLNHKIKTVFQKELEQLDMHLEDRLKNSVGLLSGGQRQALTLLMMVFSKPRLILLDEHTAALDPKNAEIVLQLTDKFVKEYKLTAMMITHNMNSAIQYGNRLLMMDKGEVIFDVVGEEKKNLTVEKLVNKFHELRHVSFQTDKVLLSEKYNTD
ncbi:MAG: ABC transporter ATP-binding protein [Spirochaetes bacterium GWB1_27_13]|nr:MAG: ABC transporter ATP-binding protein [Spirochaetes bacterium GWB1_27_13]